MTTILFYILLIILFFDYIFEHILDYLNLKALNGEVPQELSDIYDAGQYKKSMKYERETTRFSFLTSTFSFILILCMLFFKGFAVADEIVRHYVSNKILITVLFFGVLMFLSDLLNIPFELYSIFVIEEKYGFNKTTVKTYITDKLKGWMLGVIIGGGLLALITWFYFLTQEMFWIYTWVAVSIFSLFMLMFYSSLIVPLFNKQTPLPDGELRAAIETFSVKAGFKLKNIFIIDGSKRSTKANANFTGIGAKKRIVLYDTLVNDFSVNEVLAVLAHEIGHYKKKHTLYGVIQSIIQTGLMLFILSMFVSKIELSQALGSTLQTPVFHLGLICFGIMYSPFSFLIGIIMNVLSRKHEYEADFFAKSHGLANELISSLKKLSQKNLSNLTPHWLYVFFHYSHPTLLQRIRAINSVE